MGEMIKVELHPNFDVFNLHQYGLSRTAKDLLSILIFGVDEVDKNSDGLSELIELEIIVEIV